MSLVVVALAILSSTSASSVARPGSIADSSSPTPTPSSTSPSYPLPTQPPLDPLSPFLVSPVPEALIHDQSPNIQQHLLAPRQAQSIQIPANAAAGGISFLTPAITDSLSYHKIFSGVSITFGFTYTSVISTPASLTLEAFCSQNGNTYPVGPINAGTVTNVIGGGVTAVTWDPWAYAQQPGAVPFADATYTLRVHDERGMGVGASPGLVQPNANVRFALYSATPYTPLSSWTCPGCNGASALTLHPLMIALPITAAMMVAGGWGLLGRTASWMNRS